MKRKIVSSITALYFAICCCFTVCVVYNAVSCANNTELNDAYGYERFVSDDEAKSLVDGDNVVL